MAEDNSIINYKFALLGDSSVGKTSIFKKISTGEFFLENISTIGTDKKSIEYNDIEIEINGKTEKKSFLIELFDTAGQERYRSITKNYIKGSDGIILIYDITNTQSFENVKAWVNQIREEASSNVIIYIAGNKVDMEDERKVDRDDGEKLAEELGFPFVETSAKNGININETFEDLVERIDKVYGNVPQKPIKNKLYKANGKKCC